MNDNRRTPTDAYWALQPTILLTPTKRSTTIWWNGYIAGVLSAYASIGVGMLAVWWIVG